MTDAIHVLLGAGFLIAAAYKGLESMRYRARSVVCRARISGHVAYRSAQTGSTKRTYRPAVDVAYPDGTYGKGVIGGLAFSSRPEAVGTELDVLVDPTNVADVRRASTRGLYAQPAMFGAVGVALLLWSLR